MAGRLDDNVSRDDVAAAELHFATVSWCLYRWRTGCRKTRRIHTAVRHLCPDLSSPRPEPWLPYVFTSIDDPRLDEIVRQNRP